MKKEKKIIKKQSQKQVPTVSILQKNKEKKVKLIKSLKKNKSINLQKIKKTADRYFSLYIRLKLSDEYGMCQCVSCGVIKFYKKIHCAHWISRGCLLYRWDESNVNVACVSCNTFRKEFHIREFTLFQIENLGYKKVNEMNDRSNDIYKLDKLELLCFIEKWKKEIKKMEAKKIILNKPI